jgi:O-antigen/teichoic acid export membrane protein
VRLHDLATLTSDERSRERNRRIAYAALTAAGARVVAIATAFVSIPLTLHYLGAEEFGLWVTVSSLTVILGFADLGLSFGLMNGVAEAYGENDDEAAGKYVSSTFYLLLGLATTLGVTFFVFYPFVPWPRVFNVTSSDAVAVAGPAVAVLVSISLAGLPLGIVPMTQMAYQEVFKSRIWQAAGNVLSLVTLVIVIALKGDLPWLVLALAGGPVVASLLNGIVLVRQRSWLVPRLRNVTLAVAKRASRLGSAFFLIQISIVVAFQTDNIVIARILGPDAVTQYAIPMRLFLTIPLLASFVLSPLWPAYREALTRGDERWVRRTFFRSLGFSAALGLFLSAALVVIGPLILRAWVGGGIAPSLSFLLAMAAWTTVNCIYGAFMMYLNGIKAMRFQVITSLTMMSANLALSIVLTHLIGIPGPALGSAISVAVFVLTPAIFYVRASLIRMRQPRTTLADFSPEQPARPLPSFE